MGNGGPWTVALVSCAQFAAQAVAHAVPLDLSHYFNNQAFGTYPGESSFDVLNQSYPAQLAHSSGISVFNSRIGITYHAPRYRGPSTPDNVICSGQTISLPKPVPAFAVSILHSSDVRKKTVLGNVTFVYSDNTTSTSELRSEPWWAFLAINRGEIIYPSFYTANATNFNTSHIFESEASLSAGKELSAITLPETTNTTEGRIHVFSISVWENDAEGIPGVSLQSLRSTQKWIDHGQEKAQIVEIIVNNSGPDCVHGEGITVSIEGNGVRVVEVGHVKRLCPGDQKHLNIGVFGSGLVEVDVEISYQGKYVFRTSKNVTLGLGDWAPSNSNLARHESPQWFDNAKFGIFIHWGLYSVPAWGNSTPYESYAEWFWWYTTHRAADKSGFYDYRLRTFGPGLNYDDFLTNFTATKYQPKEWVDLIADSGAKYFVITTKHHDGFTLFNAGNTTNRTSLHYGPKKDLVKDLFDAAKSYQPDLKRGTYFSLPEWFNPSWGPYGFAQYDRPDSTTHPGIIARNPYTNQTEPYIGYVPVDDFIVDVMVPQMDILAYEYETDIMWCDAGASNGTADFASRWWTWALEKGKDVTINSRCGTAEVNDFDTPEYATFATPQKQKWESNQGMDPYSYGYNRATTDSEYMNATTLITTLVDMVSKNGNLLLNIGPRADGTIPQVEIDNLREAGKWIQTHEKSIFNTTYWFQKAEVKNSRTNVRFTQTDEAFYILSFQKPQGGELVVEAPIPILEGDKVSIVGDSRDQELKWSFDGQVLTVLIEESTLEKIDHCWVFMIEYLA